MDALSRAELVRTLESTAGKVVSIYMPVQSGADSRQNAVRLKNLLRKAESQLTARGVDRSDVRELLAPGWRLEERNELTGKIGRGLAILIGPADMRVWSLPIECAEQCVVAPRFYVLPLIVSLNNNAAYYVLALSQNQVRLLRGTRAEIEQVDVPGLPTNRDEALQLDDPEPVQQAHVSRPQVAGRGDLIFHGHGGAPDAAPAELEAYLREVDRAVAKHLRLQTDPLIFAGVDYLFPIYRQVNNYAHLLATPITGNPELWSDAELRKKAWSLVDAALREERAATVTKYGNLVAHGRATNRLEDIIIAAHAGAVETLFVDPRVQRLGVFSPETSTVHLGDSEEGDTEDLINLAVTQVLGSSGNVETLELGNVPGGGPMAAVLRYEFSPASNQVKSLKSYS